MFHGSKDRTINPRVSVVIYQKLKSVGANLDIIGDEGRDYTLVEVSHE